MPLKLPVHLALLGLLQLATLPSETRPASLSWWTVGSLIKVRPGTPAPERPEHRAEIAAARNEFEAFQIVLRSDMEDVAGLDVELSDFKGTNGTDISKSNAAVYLEQFMAVAQPSTAAGLKGLWPDPLLPRVDRYAHERRKAFPFRIRKGEDQPVWVEIFIPADAAPGKYSASASILQDGNVKFSVPVNLTVWRFTLPSTSTLRSSFGFNGVTTLKQHRGSYTSDEDLYSLTRVYQQAALQHRISIHGGTLAPPKFGAQGETIKIDWRAYDAEVAPFLDGNAIPKGEPLYGARETSIDLRTPAAFPSPGDQRSYWAQWMGHFRKHGWADRLFLYLWDEPVPESYGKVEQRGEAALKADPSIRNLLTLPFTSKLADVVQIWVPLVNCLETRPGSDDFCREHPALADYDAERQAGKSLWFYQSCASHGCGGKGGAYFDGWPSYMIDASGPANRIMQWVAWKYHIEGELYYSMNEAYAHPGDPWADLFLSGGNGDGTLFYPGRSERIGGHTDIPIESMRLKLIRDGMEDYEYLSLLAAKGDRKAADAFADRLVEKPWSSETRPDKIAQVRREMGELLDSLTESSRGGGK